MIEYVKEMLRRRKAAEYSKQYSAGYDWAAGNLLSKEETIKSLHARTYGRENEAFDKGAASAIKAYEYLIKYKKIVDDTRVWLNQTVEL